MLLTASYSTGANAADYDVPPYPGRFIKSTPLYSKTVDGWTCHFFGPCRDEIRTKNDPLPIASAAKGDSTEVSCEFGSYYLVSTNIISYVWAPRSAVIPRYRPPTCSALEWGWERR